MTTVTPRSVSLDSRLLATAAYYYYVKCYGLRELLAVAPQ